MLTFAIGLVCGMMLGGTAVALIMSALALGKNTPK